MRKVLWLLVARAGVLPTSWMRMLHPSSIRGSSSAGPRKHCCSRTSRRLHQRWPHSEMKATPSMNLFRLMRHQVNHNQGRWASPWVRIRSCIRLQISIATTQELCRISSNRFQVHNRWIKARKPSRKVGNAWWRNQQEMQLHNFKKKRLRDLKNDWAGLKRGRCMHLDLAFKLQSGMKRSSSTLCQMKVFRSENAVLKSLWKPLIASIRECLERIWSGWRPTPLQWVQ